MHQLETGKFEVQYTQENDYNQGELTHVHTQTPSVVRLWRNWSPCAEIACLLPSQSLSSAFLRAPHSSETEF